MKENNIVLFFLASLLKNFSRKLFTLSAVVESSLKELFSDVNASVIGALISKLCKAMWKCCMTLDGWWTRRLATTTLIPLHIFEINGCINMAFTPLKRS